MSTLTEMPFPYVVFQISFPTLPPLSMILSNIPQIPHDFDHCNGA